MPNLTDDQTIFPQQAALIQRFGPKGDILATSQGNKLFLYQFDKNLLANPQIIDLNSSIFKIIPLIAPSGSKILVIFTNFLSSILNCAADGNINITPSANLAPQSSNVPLDQIKFALIPGALIFNFNKNQLTVIPINAANEIGVPFIVTVSCSSIISFVSLNQNNHSARLAILTEENHDNPKIRIVDIDLTNKKGTEDQKIAISLPIDAYMIIPYLLGSNPIIICFTNNKAIFNTFIPNQVPKSTAYPFSSQAKLGWFAQMKDNFYVFIDERGSIKISEISEFGNFTVSDRGKTLIPSSVIALNGSVLYVTAKDGQAVLLEVTKLKVEKKMTIEKDGSIKELQQSNTQQTSQPKTPKSKSERPSPLRSNKNSFQSPPSSPIPTEKDLSKQIERLFEVPDTDIDPISFNDAKALNRETKDALALASFSKEWDQQLLAIQKLMSLVKGGAAAHQTFLTFQPQFLPIITENVTSLRSTLVKYSCLFVAQLAMSLGSSFETTAEQILPTLFKPTSNGTQIIADCCKCAILSICQYVTSTKIAKAMVVQISSKASIHRVICAKAFLIMAKQWDQKLVEKMKPFLLPAVDKLVVDASPEARQISRECKALLNHKQPNAEENKREKNSRKNGKKNQKFNFQEKPQIKLDDVKQYIIMGDEASLKENGEMVAKIIVDGMLSNSPLLANTCLTLFPNTVTIIPDSYKPRVQSLVNAILMYDNSTVRKHKELAYDAFNAAGNNISPSMVVAAAIKNIHVKDSMVLVTDFYNRNESLIPDDVKEEYEKIFPKQDNDSTLVFESGPNSPEKPHRRAVVFAENPQIPEVVVGNIDEEENKEQKTSILINSEKEKPEEAKPRPRLTFVLDNIPNFPPKESHEEEEETIDPEQKKKDEEQRKQPFEMTTKKLDLSQINEENPKQAQEIEKLPQEQIQPKEEQKHENTEPRPSNIMNTPDKQPQKPKISNNDEQIKPNKKETKPKEVDLRPSAKAKDNIRQSPTKAPFATDFDQPQDSSIGETQLQKLIKRLENPEIADKSPIIMRIAQIASRSGSKEYQTILPSVLPFSHSQFADDAALVASAIIRSVSHSKLLEFGASLLAQCPREAAEFLGRLSHQCSPGEIIDAAPLFMGGLKNLANDKEAVIRKAAVFCISDMWISGGDDFIQEIEMLPALTKKLVTHYYTIHK
ncbi:hypothetical protein TVAG_266910 [Trichomonas vaginalis G3]|uniref:CLASP N-terminal domain-containing protein n=1 Tax=Trichomonas vaginalis (strain ATCC PRA-98 / G3) TaxID=412133 RepID=A2DQP4_TRIV3|nr:microtubule binding CLASP family [Trichomonas vaginalis G3]EAY17328.1 hypothetical protein TVAG_266910 [Trichomonas vaginalis G3]KAI5523181.1 microtubule binding CLASP family [Trichomonas vaginalis G3]|eukprot:XP_001329551.1 hypothetical protein [Trichomonas vaginalis G3]